MELSLCLKMLRQNDQARGAALGLPGADRCAGPNERPLWLTVGEANTLLTLSCTSPVYGGDAEQDLFLKLAHYIRTF